MQTERGDLFLVKGSNILPIILVGLTPLLVFTLIVVGVAVGPVRWEPPNLWSSEFGTTGADIRNRMTSLSADAGGVFAGGYVGQVGDGGPVSQLFVSRYDLSHRQVWFRGFGNFTEAESIRTVVAAADGAYAAGMLNASGFVRKYDLKGDEVWTDLLGSPLSRFLDVSAGPAGVYALGYYPANTTNTNASIILRNYDFNGSVLWTKRIGEVSATNSGNVFASAKGLYVSGSIPVGYLQRYDVNGTLLWNRQFTCVCWPSGVSGDGTGVYVAGQEFRGILQGFVAKYDWDGNQVWMREFRPPSTEVDSLSMSANPSGVYMAMTTKIGNYLSKYDDNGNSVWLFRIALSPYAVSVGGSSVFVGGDRARGTEGWNAALSEFGQSSSLIFFGLIPPFSFLVVGVLVAAATISILWLRKRAKSRELELIRRANR